MVTRRRRRRLLLALQIAHSRPARSPEARARQLGAGAAALVNAGGWFTCARRSRPSGRPGATAIRGARTRPRVRPECRLAGSGRCCIGQEGHGDHDKRGSAPPPCLVEPGGRGRGTGADDQAARYLRLPLPPRHERLFPARHQRALLMPRLPYVLVDRRFIMMCLPFPASARG